MEDQEQVENVKYSEFILHLFCLFCWTDMTWLVFLSCVHADCEYIVAVLFLIPLQLSPNLSEPVASEPKPITTSNSLITFSPYMVFHMHVITSA